MFISFFTGKVILSFGISLIMKEKSNASALTPSQRRPSLHPATLVSAPRCVRLCSQRRLCLLPRALTVGIGLRRSTVAHFARKVRGTNIGAAKHGLKIQQSNALERWSCSLRVRGPHFASKVSYNAGAATDDCASTNLHCKGAAYNLGCSKSRKVSVRF